MFSSIHSGPVVLNQNYSPLKSNNRTLEYYFEQSLKLLDQCVKDLNIESAPIIILTSLLKTYLQHSPSTSMHSGRIYQARELVVDLISSLKYTNETPEMNARIGLCFTKLNSYSGTINRSDDLVWLLSAYCSIFPNMLPTLTNDAIKSTLVIRDINNIYYNTIIKKYADNCLNDTKFSVNEKDLFIAEAAGTLAMYCETATTIPNLNDTAKALLDKFSKKTSAQNSNTSNKSDALTDNESKNEPSNLDETIFMLSKKSELERIAHIRMIMKNTKAVESRDDVFILTQLFNSNKIAYQNIPGICDKQSYPVQENSACLIM